MEEGSERYEYVDVLRSARTENGIFLRRRIEQRNRACLNAIHPDAFHGDAFEQMSCHGSQAQADLTDLGASIVEQFEDRVDYQEDPDPEKATWRIDEYRPRGKAMYDFVKAAHEKYSKKDLNNDEREFAQAIDRVPGLLWSRNPTTAAQGYGIPLPQKGRGLLERSTPTSDLLKGGECWAVDTTGRHLLDTKVRGKLIDLGRPMMALVVRGEVDLGERRKEGQGRMEPCPGSHQPQAAGRAYGRPPAADQAPFRERLAVGVCLSLPLL